MTHSDGPSSDIGDPVPQFLVDWLEPFRGAFSSPTWRLMLVLVMGALLAPGKRTVSACLRVTGQAMCETFSSYHQVLNRARWDPRDLARRLVLLLVARLAEQGPIIIGLDDTIERRWGAHINARGIYRDPVRSNRLRRADQRFPYLGLRPRLPGRHPFGHHDRRARREPLRSHGRRL